MARINNSDNAEELLINRLRLSPLEYIENFLWIQPKMGASQLLKLKPAQRQYLKIVTELQKQNVPIRIIILKSRQVGISTATESLIFHNTSTFQNVRSMIIAQDKETAEIIFRMSRLFYDRLPSWLKPMRRYNTKQNILFENPDEKTRKTNPGLGSAIYIGTAKTVTLGSGYTLNNLHISELAKWKKPEDILLSVFQAVPSMPGSFICIESTAQGRGGYFYDMWKASLAGETGFTPIFLSWLIDPDCDFPDISESHKREIMGSLDDEEEELVAKHNATVTQLAWRRWAIPNNCQGNIELFNQEYPSCLIGDTLVSTDLGIIRIDEAETAKETESGTIEHWGPQPVSEIFQLTTKSGRTLKGTADHPIAIPSGGFIELSCCEPGQHIQLRPPRFADYLYTEVWHPILGSSHSVEIDETWARFLGYFMGDGSWYKGTISVVCDAKDMDVVEDVESALGLLFDATLSRKIHQRTKGCKGAIEVKVSHLVAFEIFKKLGIIHSFPNNTKYRRKVHTPKCIFRSPKNIVREFLRALFECDGSASSNVVRWSSSKIEFAREIQLLLLGFNINAPMRSYTKKTGSGNIYYSYNLELDSENSRLFHTKIGFIGQRKKSGYFPASHIGRPPKKIDLVDEVKSVEIIGRDITYDFTISPSHVFSANGILTHNTESRAFLSSGQSVFGRAAIKTYYDMTKSGDKGYLDHFNATTLRFMEDSVGKWEIWNKPKEGARYVVGVDPAQGTEEGDYSVIEVFDTQLEQCAEYRARINPHLFKYEVIKAAKYYNNAMVNLELNGPGYGIIGWLRERYFNFWKREKFDHEHRKKTETIGFDSTPQSMGVLRERLLSVVGYKTISIYSRVLVQEMETLEYKNTIDGAWEAKSGEHDDTIVACGLALLCLDQLGLFSPGSGLLNKPYRVGSKELNEAALLINNNSPNYTQNQMQGFDSWYLG